jgi:2-C-methyl-D-erythritol 4-phosphate cytidylyltransferase/2-C-methyl-D-erythritol 2,4-cyclodiphosphate synthase
VLRRTVDAFASHRGIDGIVVVTGPDELDLARSILLDIPKLKLIVPGGSSRQESVYLGLCSVKELGADRVLVHDGARPLVSADTISRCLQTLDEHSTAIAAIPLNDTLKRATPERVVEQTLDRENLWLVQTPQGFHIDTLIGAHESARRANFIGTDDASLIEEFSADVVHLIVGGSENIKLTRTEDLDLAEAVLRSRAVQMATRVGTGYDIHRFADGRTLYLGGVEIESPSGRGLDGHSDADVLLHAICDALLGAAGLPDIGHLFPNTDKTWKNIRSTELLKIVRCRIREAGLTIVNIDSTVIAEEPRIAPYIPQMRTTIAEVLELEESQIGIKATTNEGIGALGDGVGIAAHAVAGVIQFR